MNHLYWLSIKNWTNKCPFLWSLSGFLSVIQIKLLYQSHTHTTQHSQIKFSNSNFAPLIKIYFSVLPLWGRVHICKPSWGRFGNSDPNWFWKDFVENWFREVWKKIGTYLLNLIVKKEWNFFDLKTFLRYLFPFKYDGKWADGKEINYTSAEVSNFSRARNFKNCKDVVRACVIYDFSDIPNFRFDFWALFLENFTYFPFPLSLTNLRTDLSMNCSKCLRERPK